MHTIFMPDTPEARAIIAYHATTCPQFVTLTGRKAEWSDATTPRTDRPVRFYWQTLFSPASSYLATDDAMWR